VGEPLWSSTTGNVGPLPAALSTVSIKFLPFGPKSQPVRIVI